MMQKQRKGITGLMAKYMKWFHTIINNIYQQDRFVQSKPQRDYNQSQVCC